jgi:hypothetical protein
LFSSVRDDTQEVGDIHVIITTSHPHQSLSYLLYKRMNRLYNRETKYAIGPLLSRKVLIDPSLLLRV